MIEYHYVEIKNHLYRKLFDINPKHDSRYGKALARSGFTSLSTAYIAALGALLSGGITQQAIKYASQLLSFMGISINVTDLASDIKSYRKDISNLKKDFVMACNEAAGK